MVVWQPFLLDSRRAQGEERDTITRNRASRRRQTDEECP